MASRENQTLVQAWLDPDNDLDAAVIDIIKALNSDGWSNKQIIVDAVLKAAGTQPEFYTDANAPENAMLLRNIRKILSQALDRQTQTLLEQLEQELAARIHSGETDAPRKPSTPFGSTNSESVTPAMRNLAAGILARQKQVRGDSE